MDENKTFFYKYVNLKVNVQKKGSVSIWTFYLKTTLVKSNFGCTKETADGRQSPKGRLT